MTLRKLTKHDRFRAELTAMRKQLDRLIADYDAMVSEESRPPASDRCNLSMADLRRSIGQPPIRREP